MCVRAFVSIKNFDLYSIVLIIFYSCRFFFTFDSTFGRVSNFVVVVIDINFMRYDSPALKVVVVIVFFSLCASNSYKIERSFLAHSFPFEHFSSQV